MANNTINAANNPALANQMAEKVLADSAPKVAPAVITPPSDTLVNLPGGYIAPAGEVVQTAEVRELNGRDEEAIGRITSLGKILSTILERAVVKLGGAPINETFLNNLLAGDRDALLLGIYKATFGNTAEVGAFCSGCNEVKTVAIDVDSDIKTRVLTDPINDRVFTVSGKNEYTVTLPTGLVQKEIAGNMEKSTAELTTILLENTILEINGSPVLSKFQVQSLGVTDRRKISEEIFKRNPGPQFEELTIECPDCSGKVVVPISLGALFRF